MFTVSAHQNELQDLQRQIHTNDTIVTPNSKPCYRLLKPPCRFLTHLLHGLPDRFVTIFLVQSLDDSICNHPEYLYESENNNADGNNGALPFDEFDRAGQPLPIIMTLIEDCHQIANQDHEKRKHQIAKISVPKHSVM